MTRVVFSSGWKLSRDARGIFQRLETFLRHAWYFPGAGNLPAMRVGFSRGWKPSCDPWADFWDCAKKSIPSRSREKIGTEWRNILKEH
jgi:hypothetical protein